MRTFPKHEGQNFSAEDFRDSAAGYVWRPLSGARAFDYAVSAREVAEDRRKNKAFALHIGTERVEVAGDNPERRMNAYGRTLTPQDLTDEELATLAEQLNTQVRETDANARALADEAASDFQIQKAVAISTLEGLLVSLKSAEDLGLDLLKARVDIDRALAEWKNRYFKRSEVLQDYKASATLVLARDVVNAERAARRAVKNAKQAELKAMLAEAGIHI